MTRMLLYCRRLHLPSLMVLWLLCSLNSSTSNNTLCPASCSCRQNDKGKRKVSCIKGGLSDPIPISQMDPGMEVLEITAPDDKRNTLSITPIFQNFKQLEELHITQSNVIQIHMHAFWGVPSLKILDLSLNNISAVLDHNFRGLVNLIDLNLDDNRISRLQAGVFKHLTELRVLSLQRNLLQELVPKTFLKLVKLHVLKISGNKFDELDPEAFKEILELRTLECRNCGLRRINTQIYHLLPYLSHLDLGYNEIQFLSNDEFQDLHRLHSLKLDGNLLPVILENTFVNQQQLRYLCLARNRIAKIPDTAFKNLTNLTELDIGYNKFNRLESMAISHFVHTLQRLVISGNNFNMDLIKLILNALHKVWYLEIAQMKYLEMLPNNFIPDRIKKLNISHNNISEISKESLPKQLVELDISHNKIKGLNDSVIVKLESLKYVNLSGNPWTCTLCYITPIFFRVNKSEILRNLTCAFPSELSNKKISLLSLEEIVPCTSEATDEKAKSQTHNKSLLIGLICILFSAVCSIIFVVCSCVKRHTQNRATQEKRRRRTSGVQENNAEQATAIFCKDEISFKFPLDLTERQMSVSTIDEIKQERHQNQDVPNGTARTGL